MCKACSNKFRASHFGIIMMKRLNENFEIHDTLNPKLFDIDTGKLLPEVRQKLIEVVQFFESELQAPLDICDVQLVGSNVSYNYTNNSDLDVHLIANFDTLNTDTTILQALCDAKRKEFEKK